jgi:hypothetical protein
MFDPTFLPPIEAVAGRLKTVRHSVAMTDRANMPASSKIPGLLCCEELLADAIPLGATGRRLRPGSRRSHVSWCGHDDDACGSVSARLASARGHAWACPVRRVNDSPLPTVWFLSPLKVDT